MNTRIRTLLILIILAGLKDSACNAVITENATPMQPSTSISTAVQSATLPAPVTSMPAFQLDTSCWPIKPLQEGNEIKGSIVYAYFAHSASETNDLFAWDINSFRTIKLDFESKLKRWDDGYVSPDGKSVAAASSEDLVVISPDHTRSFPLPHKGVYIRTYLPDGNILLLDRQNRDDAYREGVGLTDIFYILDPETGELKEHSVFLPNLQQELHNTFAIQYSPNMKYVLYKSLSEKHDGESIFTLYDLEKKEVVWAGPPHEPDLKNNAWTVPAWRPDSSGLTGMYFNENGTNYYSISLDGELSHLTNFKGAELYTTQSDKWWSGFAEYPNWSSNNRYLVLSGSKKGDDSAVMGRSLYVWDDQEKVVYKPCLPSEEDRFSRPYFTHWSFDGSYFLVELTFVSPMDVPTPEKFPKSYILDLTNQIIFEIPDVSDLEAHSTSSDEGYNAFLGWVDWEIP